MPVIDTSLLTEDEIRKLSASAKQRIYNGLDCCITFEVFGVISTELLNQNVPGHRLVYDFERGMQAPALEMMERGFKIDEYERRLMVEKLEKKLARVESILNRFAFAVWGKGLNANSPKQLQNFFYKQMGLPEVVLNFKGVRRVTTNREALEKLSVYLYAVPFINCILAIRDYKKKLSLLTTEISADRRFHTSYGVAATTTGRWASYTDAFGLGSNLQNVSVELRKPFVADKGYKLFHLDLEQAESRGTGMLVWKTVGDDSYLNACESGDLHTYVAKLIWPDRVEDKRTAEALFYRHFSFRDMSKRGGHASNYRVTPFTMSRHLKVALETCRSFQGTYFTTFPGIPKWHNWVAGQLGLHSELETLLGRPRTFFGRPDDDETLRQAIAFGPQGTIGDLLNVILWLVWYWGKTEKIDIQLLTQEHDGFTLQYPENRGFEKEVFPEIERIAKQPIVVESLVKPGVFKTLTVPCDISVGWNWAPGDKPPFWDREKNVSLNPNGLMKWRGYDDRRRIEGLDRVVS